MTGLGVTVRRYLATALLYTVIIVLAVGFMLPYVFALSSSLKTHAEIHLFPPRWLPSRFRWENYLEVFVQVPFGRFIRNTIVVVLLAGIGEIVSSAVVAYGFARIRFPGRDFMFILVLSTMMLPWVVTIIPTFIMFKYLRWLDTYKPLIVPGYFGVPYFVFLLRQFFATIPRALDEAATIDGASRLRTFVTIILPLSKPALATVAIFAALGKWNEFMGPLIYLNTEEKFTVALGLRLFQRTASAGGKPVDQLLMAASIITTAPAILLFFTMQQYFVQGIVMTGIKG
ncbi:MAG: carbohydrate ABC transporter permease [Chloroflexi bacterium]|nr:carbohydrate ABC transporter permease [Chloroflexota bacterium]